VFYLDVEFSGNVLKNGSQVMDGAPSNIVVFVWKFLIKRNIPLMLHSLYSSDLAPNEFFCSY
jgi:hypothetical protein